MKQETINEVLKFRDDIVYKKVQRNKEKYPVEKAYGNKEKYTQL